MKTYILIMLFLASTANLIASTKPKKRKVDAIADIIVGIMFQVAFWGAYYAWKP